MNGRAHDETDEAGAQIVPAGDTPDLSKGLYGKGRRTLEEHELASPVGTRFMIDRIDHLEEEVRALSSYREKFYKADADLRVEQGRGQLADTTKNVASGLLAAGSAGAGIVASFLALSKFSVALFVVFVVIAIGSFALKVKDRG